MISQNFFFPVFWEQWKCVVSPPLLAESSYLPQGSSTIPQDSVAPKGMGECLAWQESPSILKCAKHRAVEAVLWQFPECWLPVCSLHFSEYEAETEISDLIFLSPKQRFLTATGQLQEHTRSQHAPQFIVPCRQLTGRAQNCAK